MSYLRGHNVYLSGPIELAQPCVNWRTEPVKILTERFHLNVHDPYADPKQQWAASLHKARQERDFDTMVEIAKRFVQKDLSMVSRSDILVAYLPYKVSTTGTHHEIIHANSDKKPVLIVCPQGKQMAPLWYYGFIKPRHMFDSWDQLYSYLDEVEAGGHKADRRWHLVYGMI